ncbi:MAG TPA: tripartite tricarboxylate transporter TctB family protein, partial [Acidobacteria bacterium]|nr:tripartite tricarboxylate transporter TctB family protein [Acidobacteriota bacterium]
MPPDRRLAVGLIAGSAAYLFGAFQIGAPEGQYAAVGPRLFPLVIGLGLLTSAVWIGVAATAEVRRSPVRWGAAASSALAFLAYIAALDVVGYLPATAAFL